MFQVEIACLLAGEGGGGAVAGPDFIIDVKAAQTLQRLLHDHFVAAVEIAASDGAAEERVACDEIAAAGEAHGADGVAGRVLTKKKKKKVIEKIGKHSLKHNN